LEHYEALGRPCPRVELLRGNLDAAQIALLVTSPSAASGRLLPEVLRLHTRRLSPRKRLDLLDRVIYAVEHPRVRKVTKEDEEQNIPFWLR
jgi:hypothetical protein